VRVRDGVYESDQSEPPEYPPPNDELDDDEIFDESLTEVHKADDDKAIIVEEDGIFIAPDDEDEIEIIPDPKR